MGNWSVLEDNRSSLCLFCLFVVSGWLLLALSACSMPGGTKPVVKVGLVAPFEGFYRAIGYEALYGVKLAVRERNAAGGVGGYMIELVALNDDNDPTEAAFQARELAVDPEVMGVVAGWSAEVAAAALPGYQTAGMGVVVPWAVPGELARRDAGTVLLAASSEQLALSMARYAAEAARPEHPVVLYAPPGRPDELRNAAAEQGLHLAGDISLGDPNWQDKLCQSREVDLLLYSGDVAHGADALLAARGGGVEALFIGDADLGSRLLPQIAQRAADGTLYVAPAPAPGDLPGTASFVAGYRALAGYDPGPRAVLAYDATNVLLDALEFSIHNNGGLTRHGVAAALGAVRRDGLVGSITFDDAGRRENPPTWVYQIAGGYPGYLVAKIL
jgi:branched-chain amino acid transport system substrate-binding protein